ncbi:hypothetical protein [Nakamurella sp. PAMC28650]|uniref:hypothetical protein n=1 Tax=Nakamurella sp. PAMC28650 TaxID=2762325 RepID=UPI00164DC712|nr:hypothetical protein [Nakamurella sp. PAMC28650]QNK82557.1 hypothetical protein H7F38_07580 [Nakamurella sp. PAMC28650]
MIKKLALSAAAVVAVIGAVYVLPSAGARDPTQQGQVNQRHGVTTRIQSPAAFPSSLSSSDPVMVPGLGASSGHPSSATPAGPTVVTATRTAAAARHPARLVGARTEPAAGRPPGRHPGLHQDLDQPGAALDHGVIPQDDGTRTQQRNRSLRHRPEQHYSAEARRPGYHRRTAEQRPELQPHEQQDHVHQDHERQYRGAGSEALLCDQDDSPAGTETGARAGTETDACPCPGQQLRYRGERR